MKNADSGTRRRMRAALIGAASAVPKAAPPPPPAIKTGKKRPPLAANRTATTAARQTRVSRATRRESTARSSNASAKTAARGAYRLVGFVANANPNSTGAIQRLDLELEPGLKVGTHDARPSIAKAAASASPRVASNAI